MMKLTTKIIFCTSAAAAAATAILTSSPGYEKVLNNRKEEILSDARYAEIQKWFDDTEISNNRDTIFHLVQASQWPPGIKSLAPRYMKFREKPKTLFLDWGGGLSGSNGCIIYDETYDIPPDQSDFHMLKARPKVYSVYEKSHNQKLENQ